METKGETHRFSEIRRLGKKRSYDSENLQTALKYLNDGKTIRQASIISNVPYATLRRRWLQFKDMKMSSSCESRPPLPSEQKLKSILKKKSTNFELDQPLQEKFTKKQEIKLANLFNGKNFLECRRMVYEMAFKWNVSLYKNWYNEKMADIDWFENFRKNVPGLLDNAYINTQKTLQNDGTSKNCNDKVPRMENTNSTNHLSLHSSTNRRPSNSSESSEYDCGNDSTSDSNFDFNVIKVENDNDTDDSYETSCSCKSKNSRNTEVQKRKNYFTKKFEGVKTAWKQNLDSDRLFFLSLLQQFKSIPESKKNETKIKLLKVFNKI